MPDEVFTPEPEAIRDGTSAIALSPAGLSGADKMLMLRPGYLGPVATWDSGPAGERVRVTGRITKWNGNVPLIEYETERI